MQKKLISDIGLYFQKHPVILEATVLSPHLRHLECYFHESWMFPAPMEISKWGGCSTSRQATAVLLQRKNVKTESLTFRRCYPIL